MAKIYEKATWQDEILAGDERYNILENGGGAFKANMQIALATAITQAATVLTAALMNNIENGIDGLDTKIAGYELEGTNLTAQATTNIGAAGGQTVTITGTTTITSFGTAQAGIIRVLKFSSTPILAYNATALKLPGGANINIAAGDVVVMESEGSGNWKCISYLPIASKADNSGWIPVADTWTYASATTVTVPSGAAALYQKGVRVRFKQGGAYKYLPVYSVADTLLTFFATTDYSVANAAITDIAYSYAQSPLGWPDMFNYAPTVAGYSINPTNLVRRFEVIGSKCRVVLRDGAAGTSNATDLTMTAPCAARTLTNMTWVGIAAAEDNGVSLLGRSVLSSAGTTISFNSSFAGGAWTPAGNKRISYCEMIYDY